MRCNDFDCLRYVEGDYDKKATERIRQHISTCSGCRKKIDGLAIIAHMLRNYSISKLLKDTEHAGSLFERIITSALEKESRASEIPFAWDRQFIQALSSEISRKFSPQEMERGLNMLIFDPLNEFKQQHPGQWKTAQRIVMKYRKRKRTAATDMPLRFMAVGKSPTVFNAITQALPQAEVRRSTNIENCTKALKKYNADMLCIDIDACSRPGKITGAVSTVKTIRKNYPDVEVVAATRQMYTERDKRKLLATGVALVYDDTARDRDLTRLGYDVLMKRKENLMRFDQGGDVKATYSQKNKTLNLIVTVP